MGSITINGKNVKKWVIGGKTVQNLKMGGKLLAFRPPNEFGGTWSSPAKQAEFIAINEIVADNQFENENNINFIKIPNATTIGAHAFANAPLNMLEVPKATVIGDGAFSSIKNAVVTMNKKFGTDAEKDRIFGAGNWNNASFNLVNDDGSVYIPSSSDWHYGDGASGPHPTKNDWIGDWSTPEKQAEFEAITNTVGDTKLWRETSISGISLPQTNSIGSGFLFNSPLNTLVLPELLSVGHDTFTLSNNIVKYLKIPKVTTVGTGVFDSKLINAPTTEVWINKKYNTELDKNDMFGADYDADLNSIPKWDQITFHWTNDDGTPYTGAFVAGPGGLDGLLQERK